jgi:hypothetical protein
MKQNIDNIDTYHLLNLKLYLTTYNDLYFYGFYYRDITKKNRNIAGVFYSKVDKATCKLIEPQFLPFTDDELKNIEPNIKSYLGGSTFLSFNENSFAICESMGQDPNKQDALIIFGYDNVNHTTYKKVVYVRQDFDPSFTVVSEGPNKFIYFCDNRKNYHAETGKFISSSYETTKKCHVGKAILASINIDETGLITRKMETNDVGYGFDLYTSYWSNDHKTLITKRNFGEEYRISKIEFR